MATPCKELVEDICTRFILTAPAEEHQSFEHLMFLVEEAHWYYEDTVRDKDRHLKTYNLNSFTRMIFEVCPELCAYAGDLEDILGRFREYKKNVPAMGAIILDADMDRVLLVKGYQSAACWGFPKGKISSMDASHAKCAIREVLEETAFDIEPYLKEEDCISKEVMGKRMKLYIIPGVDHLTTEFFPKCKGEIGAYAWHLVSELPTTYEEDKQTFISMDGTRHKFFTVWPFVKALKEWIARKKGRKLRHTATSATATAKGATGKPRNGTANNALFKHAMAAATAPSKLERQQSDPTQAHITEAASNSNTASSPSFSFQAPLPGLPSQGADLLSMLNGSSRSSSLSPTSSSSSSALDNKVQHLAATSAGDSSRLAHTGHNPHQAQALKRGKSAALATVQTSRATSASTARPCSNPSSTTTTTGGSETSPTAPSTPPPMTSLPKVYTAADLEGRITTVSQSSSTSGAQLLSLLLSSDHSPVLPSASAAVSQQPERLKPQHQPAADPAQTPSEQAASTALASQGRHVLAALSGTTQSTAGATWWADFRFDVPAIMHAFD